MTKYELLSFWQKKIFEGSQKVLYYTTFHKVCQVCFAFSTIIVVKSTINQCQLVYAFTIHYSIFYQLAARPENWLTIFPTIAQLSFLFKKCVKCWILKRYFFMYLKISHENDIFCLFLPQNPTFHQFCYFIPILH